MSKCENEIEYTVQYMVNFPSGLKTEKKKVSYFIFQKYQGAFLTQKDCFALTDNKNRHLQLLY